MISFVTWIRAPLGEACEFRTCKKKTISKVERINKVNNLPGKATGAKQLAGCYFPRRKRGGFCACVYVFVWPFYFQLTWFLARVNGKIPPSSRPLIQITNGEASYLTRSKPPPAAPLEPKAAIPSLRTEALRSSLLGSCHLQAPQLA